MPSRDRLAYFGGAYVWSVVALGVLAVVHSIAVLIRNPVPWQWTMLALLTLLSGSFTVRIPGVSARLSVSDTFVFAAVLMFGPAAATMIVVLDTLVISFWQGRSAAPPQRIFFNIAAPALAIWGASHIIFFLTGFAPLSVKPQAVLSIVLPLFALAGVYFLLNSWLIAFAVSFQRRVPPFGIWRKNFLWLSLNYFSGASVAALLLPYLLQADTYDSFLYVTGVLLPVLLIFYLTFKAALGRVEDANSHLSELNRLYLSTIETLAMAIDAKDQITHGHIRRVQQYAVGLAKAIGVTDRAQISAIEAASLLHDMGKLAVPEYILNKPGKLTVAEFEKMKLHASVGADILSAIDFPYPVVPLVRHHHENWDGTGYPDGLTGINIPIGARILAVVDCFDALTSDRPYRPRLSDDEAIKILLDRRGTMYDPLVVDAFISVYNEIAATIENTTPVGEGLSAITRGVAPAQPSTRTSRLDEISASTEEMLVLYDLAKSLTSNLDLAQLAEVVSTHLRRIVPATTCAFFVYSAVDEQLHATNVIGEHASQLTGLRISRGQRLTGWVAANKKTIINSDPILDLGDTARMLKPRLRSCLSTALVSRDQLLGVLTLYSTQSDAFSEEHRRIIEAVARQISGNIEHAFGQHRRPADFRDQLTGLPNAQHFREVVAPRLTSVAGLGVIVLKVRNLWNKAEGDGELDTMVLQRFADAVRQVLGSHDLLFRFDTTEFLVLLTQADGATVANVAKLLAPRLLTAFGELGPGIIPEVYIGVAAAPDDGLTIDSLVTAAQASVRAVNEPPYYPSVH